jgi:hypothetical protein
VAYPWRPTLPLSAHRASDRRPNAGHRVGHCSDGSQARFRVYAGTCHLLFGRAWKAIGVLETIVKTLKLDQANIDVAPASTVDLASADADAGDLQRFCALLASTCERLKASEN